MFRILTAMILVQAASAGVMDFSSAATWSYTNNGGSNGPDSASSGGGTTVAMNFDLSALPAGSLVTGAFLTIIPSTTAVFQGASELNCDPTPSPLTFFGEASGCSDIFGALFMDTYLVDGAPPGTMSTLIPFPPIFVDPAAIIPGGTYSVPIFSSASMSFAEWDEPGLSGQTPVIPAFSVNGSGTGTLEVDFSSSPEPGSAGLFVIGLIAAGIARGARQRQNSRR